MSAANCARLDSVLVAPNRRLRAEPTAAMGRPERIQATTAWPREPTATDVDWPGSTSPNLVGTPKVALGPRTAAKAVHEPLGRQVLNETAWSPVAPAAI